ncbi:MAG: hypothetical protein KC615_06105 [Anaerolineae bacterium]|nr:hypothetical protein [Anaerolineae bacterium]
MADKPKRKHGEPKPRWKVGLWTIVLGLLLIALHFLVFEGFFGSTETVLYLLSSKLLQEILKVYGLGSLFVIPFFALICLLRGLMAPRFNSYFWGAFVLVVSSYWLFVLGMFGDSVEVIDSAEIQGRTYLLTVIHEYDDLGFSPAGLYECDENNFACRLIYKEGWTGSYRWKINDRTSVITVISGQYKPTVVFEYQVE